MSQDLIDAVHEKNFEQVKYLINHGAEVNGIGRISMPVFPYLGTALHRAAIDGNIKMMELLLASGADIEAIAAENGFLCRTPLGLVVSECTYINNDQSMRWLLQHGASMDVIGQRRGYTTMIKQLVSDYAKSGYTQTTCIVLCEAVIRGDRSSAMTLFEAGASFDTDEFNKQFDNRKIFLNQLFLACKLLDELKDLRRLTAATVEQAKTLLQSNLVEVNDSKDFPDCLKTFVNQNSSEKINNNYSLKILTSLLQYARGRIDPDAMAIESLDPKLIDVENLYEFIDPKNNQKALVELDQFGEELINIIRMAAMLKDFPFNKRYQCISLLTKYESLDLQEIRLVRLEKNVLEAKALNKKIDTLVFELEKQSNKLDQSEKKVDQLLLQNVDLLEKIRILEIKISELETQKSISLDKSGMNSPFWTRLP